jgi:dTDP-4-amino-4,6-dideoxygalactose transaminase
MLLERYRLDRCLLCASGTHALQTALSALAGEGKEKRPVLLPAFTCYEVATAAVGARARVALYDVDPLTLEPDWDSVSAAGRHGAAALVVAPLFGMPVEWGLARETAERLGAPLVADVAQSYGATWQGLPAGSTADVVVLSFGRGKGWTGAGGGALLWRASVPGLDARADAVSAGPDPQRDGLATAAAAGSQFLLGRASVYGLPASIPFLRLGETVYHEPTPPRPISRSSAAMLLANDEVSSREVLRRRRNAEHYSHWLGTIDEGVTAVPGLRMDETSGALRYPVRIRGGWSAVRSNEALRLGVASTYPTTLQELPALRPLLDPGSRAAAGAALLVRELITLPTHSQTVETERRRLVDLIVTKARKMMMPG